ncbi:MAG: hypothetical protein ACW99Q_06805 [Candidatus Kariarchaeaceae archaeon]|jgi:hypothetical protein
MAILTPTELSEVRQKVELEEADIGTIKTEINLAIQAIEDWYEGARPDISTAIDSATTFNFTNTQKKRIGKYWMRQKWVKE